jgi:uncharacterized coiled-coil protein SlyX
MDDTRMDSLETKLLYLERTVAELDALVLDYGRRTERLEEMMKLMSRRVVELGADKEPGMPAGERPPHY